MKSLFEEYYNEANRSARAMGWMGGKLTKIIRKIVTKDKIESTFEGMSDEEIRKEITPIIDQKIKDGLIDPKFKREDLIAGAISFAKAER